jgi:hypothetical protein
VWQQLPRVPGEWPSCGFVDDAAEPARSPGLRRAGAQRAGARPVPLRLSLPCGCECQGALSCGGLVRAALRRQLPRRSARSAQPRWEKGHFGRSGRLSLRGHSARESSALPPTRMHHSLCTCPESIRRTSGRPSAGEWEHSASAMPCSQAPIRSYFQVAARNPSLGVGPIGGVYRGGRRRTVSGRTGYRAQPHPAAETVCRQKTVGLGGAGIHRYHVPTGRPPPGIGPSRWTGGSAPHVHPSDASGLLERRSNLCSGGLPMPSPRRSSARNREGGAAAPVGASAGLTPWQGSMGCCRRRSTLTGIVSAGGGVHLMPIRPRSLSNRAA